MSGRGDAVRAWAVPTLKCGSGPHGRPRKQGYDCMQGKNTSMNRIVSLVFAFILLLSVPFVPGPAAGVAEDLTAKIIPSINRTFGYDIFRNGKLLIHQPNIPGRPGNEGFKSKEKAQAAAEFVMKKIANNIMPPTVTIDDLETMNALDGPDTP